MSNNIISHREVIGVKPGDNDMDIIRKYKKKLKIAKTDYERQILFNSYQACINEIAPQAFDTSNIKSQEQLKKLNSEIENNPDLQSALFGQKRKANLFNSETFLSTEQMERTRQEFGQGNSLNLNKFNNFFDEMYANKAPQQMDYSQLKSVDLCDEFTSQFQSVASHGGNIMHMGEFSHDDFQKPKRQKLSNVDFNNLSGSRMSHDAEYTPSTTLYTSATKDKSYLENTLRQDLEDKSEINKAFIALNAQRMGRQVQFDDTDNRQRIDGLIRGVMH